MNLRSLLGGTCLAVALLLVAGRAPAAEPTALPETLRELAGTGRVLVVTAHPDDENNAVLAALARGRGLRVVLLTLTRGEGGQNAITSHRGDALGLLRTGESLAARRVDGAEQMFGRAVDFGYSFSVEETLARWGGEEALADVVRAVRVVRPDVVLTLPLQSTEGGQAHQAAARLAREAFRAAADPRRFAEQIAAGLRPWQAAKLYEGGVGGAAFAGAVTILTTPVDPLLRVSYQEIGQQARAAHRTQGSLLLPAANPRFNLVDSALPAPVPEADPLDGIDTTLPGLRRVVRHDPAAAALLPLLETLGDRVRAAAAAWEPTAPARTVPALRTALESLRHTRQRVSALPAGAARAELAERLDEREPLLERALALAHGLELRAEADDVTVVPGQVLAVMVTLRNAGTLPVRVERLELASGGRWPAQGGFAPGTEVAAGASVAARLLVTVPAEATPSQPFWRRVAGRDRVELVQPAFEGRPFAPAELTARVQYTSGGLGARLENTVGAVAGGRWARVAVLPLLTTSVPKPVVVSTGAARPTPFDVDVTAADHAKGGPARLRLVAPEGWRVEPAEATLVLAGGGVARGARFRVTPPPRLATGTTLLEVELSRGERRYPDAMELVETAELEPRRTYGPAAVTVLAVDARPGPGLRVGVLAGPDDGILEALRALGVEATRLAPRTPGDLRAFTTVVVGPRALEVPEIRAAQKNLLDYARGGGHVVLLAQRPDLVPDTGGVFPYPAAFSRARVTDEASPVRLLADDRLLTTPHRLGAEDWAGWVQERAVNLLAPQDQRYRDLLALADPFPLNAGEKRGALVVAPLGRGTWTYVGLALPRQLEAGVPGAFRLLANLVSRPRP